MKRVLFALSLAVVFALPVAAQTTIDFDRGFVPFFSYQSSASDNVALSTGTLVLHIPIISYPQRGSVPDFSEFISYNSAVWQAYSWSDYMGVHWQWYPDGGDLSVQTSGVTTACPADCYVADSDGTYHLMEQVGTSDWETVDGSGFNDSASGIIDPNGITYSALETPTDPFGNSMTVSTFTYTDTIGRTIPSFSDHFSWDTSFSAGCTTEYFPGPPGSTSVPIEECYSHHTISTSFGVSGVAEWNSTANLLDSVTLPNGTSWAFAYDGYGRLTSITTPTGGTISYTWNFNTSGWPYDSTVATRTISDGSSSHIWTYTYTIGSYSLMSATKVSDPDGNDINHVFNAAGYETETTYYQGIMGGGTLLKTVDTTYSGTGFGAYGDFNPALPVVVTTSMPNTSGKVSQVCTVYDDMINTPCASVSFNSSGPTWSEYGSVGAPLSYGRPIAQSESDWGSGSAGSVLRQTNTAYQWQSSSSYLNANLINQPASATITNGSSTAAETTYTYDESGYAPSGCSSTPCGALTTVNQYTTGSSYLTSHTHYSSYGMPTEVDDPTSHATTYTYDSTNMFLSEIQYPETYNGSTVHHTVEPSYDSNTGLLVSSEDQNGNTTSYGYDSMRRLTSVTYPSGGGSEAYAYTDSAAPSPYFDFTRTLSSTSSFNERGTMDGLGREVQTRTAVPSYTCPGGYAYVTMSYDDEGRKAFVSNPGCSSGTSGNTTSYDPLSRVTSMTEADGSAVYYYYGSAVTSHGGTSSESCSTSYELGYPVLRVDEAATVRQFWIDSLGRVVDVSEPASGSGFNDTCYLFDPNDNLTDTIDVGGTQQRHFRYDSLSRLISAANPESGTTYYYYTASGGGLCAGDTSAVCQRTDARSITTSYGYDEDSRLSYKTYSDSTPGVYYDYDQSAPWGLSLSNYIGNLTTTYVVSGGTNVAASCLSYDPFGHIVMDLQYIEGNTEQVAYTYNYAGAVTSISYPYPTGLAVTTGYDIANNPNEVTSSWSDSSHPNPLAQVNSNTPNGTITNMLLGNGLTSAVVLNSRLQPCRMNVNSGLVNVTACTGSAPSDNVQDFQLGYGTSNNGNLMSWSGTGELVFSRTYGYDGLNRLNSLSDSVDTTCPGLSWSYDVWGNRTAQTQTSGICGSWSQSYNTSNQITGGSFTYDANGNILGDGSHSYSYDAENHMIGVDSGTTYVYDAQGRRVQKTSSSVTTQYVYDYAQVGGVLMETQASTLTNAYVYLNNALLAEYTGGSSGTTQFIHTDHLGSTRVVTDVSGMVIDAMDFLPFGEQIAGSSTTTHKFTGYERDSESNLDNAQARYYSSAQGRFMSPDPSGIFLADLSDPQQLNLYSYVRNNPLSLTDPTGLDCVYLNDAGDGVDSVDQNSSSEECTGQDANGSPNGGIWFNGTVDPSSIQTDANSDWVFASGTAGNNQFSCAGGDCDQDSLSSFSNSIVGSNPMMVYGQGTNTGSIQSGLSFDQTVQWFQSQGYAQNWIDVLDFGHRHQLDLRDTNSSCSVHLGINKGSGQNPGQSTNGDFHVDAFNPWEPGTSAPHSVSTGILTQAPFHLMTDVLKLGPGSSQGCH